MNENSLINISINFTDTAEEEVHQLMSELKLFNIVRSIQEGQPLTEDLRRTLLGVLLTVADLFSPNLPAIDIDPQITLMTVSRDINLGRLLKERGLFRLYRLARQLIWWDTANNRIVSDQEADEDYQEGELVRLPAYQVLRNPDTGVPFVNLEEFIGWFCREAHVARSLVFMRLATIEKLVKLGIPLEKAFKINISKPSTIYKTLNEIAEWEKSGELSSIDPDVAIRIAEKSLPGKADDIALLAEDMRQNPDDAEIKDALHDAVRPALVNLLSEIAVSESSSDAISFVRHDLLKKPEIAYRIDPESKTLLVDHIVTQIDPAGTEYIASITTIPFVPDIDVVPQEVIDDLVRRLPIKNRQSLDINK